MWIRAVLCHNRRVTAARETDQETGSEALDSDGRQYLRLRQEILDRAVAPGELLLETALSARYGVSRTPVRAALVRLEHDGLIERVHRGYRVRTGSAEDVLDIYEARIALEAVAAETAATRRTELELARLVHVHDESVAAADPGAANALHRRWHEMMWAACHNGAIVSALTRLCSQLTIFDNAPLTDPGQLVTACEEHGRILDALRARDGAAAGEALRAHLTRTREVRLAELARE